MDVTSRCTLGDPNKLPEGVPQPARMPYISDKHPRQTLEVINLLRKHRELCDVVLVVGAKKIYAHRVILSACSPYFRAMFTGELASPRQRPQASSGVRAVGAAKACRRRRVVMFQKTQVNSRPLPFSCLRDTLGEQLWGPSS